MKAKSICLLCGLMAALPFSVAAAETAEAPPAAAPAPTPTQRPEPMRKEVTYLGVAVSPVSRTLASQLGLPKDTGLVVRSVLPGSPAAAVFHRNDILLKLGNQRLVDGHQLAVLVREHRDGDMVDLSYLRSGKHDTASVRLGEHALPLRHPFTYRS